jgi:hypothetical protein
MKNKLLTLLIFHHITVQRPSLAGFSLRQSQIEAKNTKSGKLAFVPTFFDRYLYPDFK